MHQRRGGAMRAAAASDDASDDADERLLSAGEAPAEAAGGVSLARSVAVCALYGCTSVSLTFFNKAVFSVYAFHFPCVLTLVQMLVCLLLLAAAHLARLVELPRLSAPLARKVLPLSLCWWAFVASGLLGLRRLNVPMFSTLRKFGVVPVLVLERALLGRKAGGRVWAAVGVMVAGGVLAGATDGSVDAGGVLLVAVCCVATALYLVLIVRVGRETRLDSFGLLYCNNVLALPMMVTYLVVFTSEVAGVMGYEYLGSGRFWGFLLFAASQATLLNVAIFLCTKVNSPLATAVTGQAKDVVTVGAGLFMFGDVKITAPKLMGLGLALAGSVLYSYVKYQQAVTRVENKNGRAVAEDVPSEQGEGNNN